MSPAAVTPVTRHSFGDWVTVTGDSHHPLDRIRPAARRPKVPAAPDRVADGSVTDTACSRRSVTPSEGGCTR
jgi:hypothetical protein